MCKFAYTITLLASVYSLFDNEYADPEAFFLLNICQLITRQKSAQMFPVYQRPPRLSPGLFYSKYIIIHYLCAFFSMKYVIFA